MLRGLNLRTVLRTVLEFGAVSKADLIRHTGLSRPTIKQVVTELVDSGILIPGKETTTEPSHHGRVAARFEFNATAGVLLGVDIGAHATVVLASDMAGEILTRTRIGSPFSMSGLREAVANLLDAEGIVPDTLRQAVISTPGTVDAHSGRLTLAPQLPSLNGEDVAALLGLKCPTLIENEMRAAVVGEQTRGVAQGFDDVIYVGLGVGVGAGMILRGQLYRGVRGTAGEIGYLALTEHKQQGGSELGAFELLAGADAFAGRGQTAAAAHPESLLAARGEPGEVTPSRIIEAAEQGDLVAVALVAEEAGYIARAVAALAVVLDPSVIVMGGGLSRAGDTLLDPVRSGLAELVPGPPPLVLQSQLGDEAAAVGAICLAVTENNKSIERTFGIGD